MESGNTKKERLEVPSGFRNLLENLTVEVLRVQPSNIYKFAAEYFKDKLHERQVKGFDDCLLGSQLDGFYRNECSGPANENVVNTAAESTERGRQFTAEASVAAAKIQAGYHGFVTRRELKTKNEAAVKIQSNFRGYSVRKHQGNRSKRRMPSIPEEDDAAIKIQAAYRGHMSRQQVLENKKTKTEAAVTIQASYRGFRERKLITKKKKDKEVAAVKIQAGFRGYRIRKLRRSQSEAAVKIQSYFRGYKTRKGVKKSLPKRSSLLGVSKPSDMNLAEHRDSRFSFSLPEDVKFEGDLDEDSDSDIEKVMDKMEAYQKSVKNMKEIYVNPDEAAKFAAEKFDNKQK